MLNIIICDDDNEDLLLLRTLIEKFFEHRQEKIKIGTFTKTEPCFEYCRFHKVDIMFLDIYIKNSLGSDLARDLREADVRCPLVFVTTSKEHALQAFSVNAVHYLVKPVKEQMVAEALERCLKRIEADLEVLVIQNKSEVLRLQQKDVFYLEVFSKHTIVHLRDKKTQEAYATLSELETQLNQDNFVKCHRSFVVNMNAVEDFTKAGLVLNGGEIIPVGAPRRREVKDKYLRFVFNCLNKEPDYWHDN